MIFQIVLRHSTHTSSCSTRVYHSLKLVGNRGKKKFSSKASHSELSLSIKLWPNLQCINFLQTKEKLLKLLAHFCLGYLKLILFFKPNSDEVFWSFGQPFDNVDNICIAYIR